MEKVQIIRCKCGSIFAGSMEPHCYIDKDWQREMRNYITKRECTVELVPAGDFKFEECKCPKTEKKQKIKSQIELF